MLKQLRTGIERTTGYTPPDPVHGFVKGRGIVTNAAQHLDQDVVLRVDLVDFFGAVDATRLDTVLSAAGLDQETASSVINVATVDGSLAQGFSTSPLLSNMAFLESDRVLASMAEGAGVNYTRYVDDLIFSGPRRLVNDSFLLNLDDVLRSLGWTVNPKKTRFMRRGRPQYVTGLYVGDRAGPHIPRSMKRLLRREVYYANKYGVSSARSKSPTPMSIERLGGWLHYAAHVDPGFGVPLRDRWFEIAPSLGEFQNSRDWDAVLDDISFPHRW